MVVADEMAIGWVAMKIIAISGSGRSGSTLLSLLLSQGENTTNLGQMRHLPTSWKKNELCSCRQPLLGCALYASVISEVFGDLPEAGLATFQSELLRLFRSAKKIRDWGDKAALSQVRTAHAETLHILRALLESIAVCSGADTLIDSSKTPEMALAFELAFPGQVQVLNLTRDPRAVAVSWHRKTKSWRNTIKSIRTFSARQARLEEWAMTLGARFHQMRYEDLATEPRITLQSAADAFGITLPSNIAEDAANVSIDWSHQHLYPPANERVISERSSLVVIRRSDNWRASKYRALHLLTRLLSGPEIDRYGAD